MFHFCICYQVILYQSYDNANNMEYLNVEAALAMKGFIYHNILICIRKWPDVCIGGWPNLTSAQGKMRNGYYIGTEILH